MFVFVRFFFVFYFIHPRALLRFTIVVQAQSDHLKCKVKCVQALFSTLVIPTLLSTTPFFKPHPFCNHLLFSTAGIRLTNCEADPAKLSPETQLCPFEFKFTPETRVMRFVGRPFAPREIRDAFVDYYKANGI
jgi:hypothetical protein